MSPSSRFFLFSLRKLLFNFYRKNHLVKPGYYRQKTWPVVVVIIQEPLYLAISNLIGKFSIWVSKIVSDWFRKLTPSTQLIRIKTKTIRDLVTRVFPHFWYLIIFYSALSRALCDLFSSPVIEYCNYFD